MAQIAISHSNPIAAANGFNIKIIAKMIEQTPLRSSQSSALITLRSSIAATISSAPVARLQAAI